MDIIEAEAPEGGIDSFEAGLKKELKSLSARTIHLHRFSKNAIEAVVKCRCSVSNSSIVIIEASNCIPVMPVTYKEGFEYCELMAFTKEDQKAALDSLAAVSTVTVEGRGKLERHLARPAMTVSVDNLIGSLTEKQLFALVEAIERGHYAMPKKATVEEIASKLGVPRSTLEEHLRKAEVKVMKTMRPYLRMAYLSSRKP